VAAVSAVLDAVAAVLVRVPLLLLAGGVILLLALPIWLAVTEHDFTLVGAVYGSLALVAAVTWAGRRRGGL
jgi:hypothetical protein